MSQREQALKDMERHPMLGNLIKKLKKVELQQCLEFIRQHDHMDKNDFAHHVNRWFLGQPKPKNHTAMWAIVSQVNVVDK